MNPDRLIWYTMPLAVVMAVISLGTLADLYVVGRLENRVVIRAIPFICAAIGVIGTLLFYMIVVGHFTNPN
ncbi:MULTISPECIES: hypothetical protein [unclassified Haloferax]|uniref:hypothetical protein n=1 Tax=unclassified Haloferax TaxID=2625095 RepID=UPI0028759292|nr:MULTISPECIES: hypothetical protein [unclassified Haloferax]MDS0243758.1 hypothetical protein [Haloferax sp. S2CR25]MDS0446879.1 hypothetical protein [Haloferax sp. S2CR25-2]